MDHPLVYRRDTIRSPRELGLAEFAVDELFESGIEFDGRHYAIYGWRRGGRFTFSHGQSFFSSLPVLRGRLIPAAGGVEAIVSVGARIETMVTWTGFVAFFAVGALYQVFLQLAGPEVPEGGRLAGLLSVLPGMGVMAAILAGGVWMLRRTATGHAEFLLEVLRASLEPAGASSVWPPVLAKAIE